MLVVGTLRKLTLSLLTCIVAPTAPLGVPVLMSTANFPRVATLKLVPVNPPGKEFDVSASLCKVMPSVADVDALLRPALIDQIKVPSMPPLMLQIANLLAS